ncbi:MAG TPA: hypothetical protein VMR41_01065 [Patescibacteria group bacterium]|nr:hypothetical protein [Patescibacteria group bacterium]
MSTMKNALIILLLVTSFLFFVPLSYAVENPLSVPNNKIGIHILFDSEISEAAKLVNSSGGDWGYVTIPIQTGDKDIDKWQHFMDQCRQMHVIPIIRLATEGDYFNTQNWREPTYDDIIDFANFLNSLNWPTKNRYVIVYNEVNRGDEWGGADDPDAYAKLLDYAVHEFKYVNPDFFIISAGLDNAAPTQGTEYMQEYTYMQDMNNSVPGIFSEVDGLDSHSYPNPGFSGSPSDNSSESVDSFSHEQQLAQQLGGKKLPIFITETGWSTDNLTDQAIAQYYQQALSTVWNDPSIVAITPFLLDANQGDFMQFSFLKPDGSQTLEYKSVFNYPKIKGQPILNSPQVLSASTSKARPELKFFSDTNSGSSRYPTLADNVRSVFKWLFKL